MMESENISKKKAEMFKLNNKVIQKEEKISFNEKKKHAL